MKDLIEHPTVKNFYQQKSQEEPMTTARPLDASWLRQLCLDAGADDAGCVEIGRPDIAGEQADILAVFPRAKTMVSFACRMNPDNVRSPARSIANVEFHHTTNGVDETARRILWRLKQAGVDGINAGATGFPMEMDRWPGRVWVVSHKTVAVAAGLGQMGIHRNVIHPKFGNFVLLGTVAIDAEVTSYSRPIDYNPCLECKLCVSACPTGAISADGNFNFTACYTHNYREFMGGFTNWVENVADSRNAQKYRESVKDSETVSMWQSLSFGANYKAAYCMAVCPAGDDVIAPFLTDRKEYLNEVVRPLQGKVETIYAVRGSDAESYVARRFPHKKVKRVGNGMRPNSIKTFLQGLPFAFQRGQSQGLKANYHFTFTGEEESKATVAIRDEALQVLDGHVGSADLEVIADSRTWIRFLAKEASLVWALLRRRIRIKGAPRLLLAFGRCFPS